MSPRSEDAKRRGDGGDSRLAKRGRPAPSVSLQKSLRSLQTLLQGKDDYGFFADPVDSSIAPGYDDVIKKPMAFSIMSDKIDANRYHSTDEYQADFMLMMKNCMTYNASDTIYYKAANKLLKSGNTIIAREKQRYLAALEAAAAEAEQFVDVDSPAGGLGGQAGGLRGGGGARRGGAPPAVAAAAAMGPALSHVPKAEDREHGQGGLVVNEEGDAVDPRCHRASSSSALAAGAGGARKELPPWSLLGAPEASSAAAAALYAHDTQQAPTLEAALLESGGAAGAAAAANSMATFDPVREVPGNRVIPVTFLGHGPFASFAPAHDASKATVAEPVASALHYAYRDATSAFTRNFTERAGELARLSRELLDNAPPLPGDAKAGGGVGGSAGRGLKPQDSSAALLDMVGMTTADEALVDRGLALLRARRAEAKAEQQHGSHRHVSLSAGDRETLRRQYGIDLSGGAAGEAAALPSNARVRLLRFNSAVLKLLASHQELRVAQGAANEPGELEKRLAALLRRNLAYLSLMARPGVLAGEASVRALMCDDTPVAHCAHCGEAYRPATAAAATADGASASARRGSGLHVPEVGSTDFLCEPCAAHWSEQGELRPACMWSAARVALKDQLSAVARAEASMAASRQQQQQQQQQQQSA